jgi:hypothetical protein
MYIAPTNTKYLEMAQNASSVVIGPVSQTGTRNVSTVINGVRIDSHVTNQNLLITQGNNKYNVTTSSYPTNVCNTIVSNIGFSVNNVTGDHCTAVGHNCLTNNSTGKYNIAIGADTLTNVTTGGYNTALGGLALNVANDSNQVAVGYNALGRTVTATYPNVAVGTNALQNFNDSTGGAHVAIGHSALGSLTSGTGSIAIGYLADNCGTINTTATNNICIGNQATSNNNINCICIGASASATGANQIILGSSTGAHTTYIQGSGGLNVTGPVSFKPIYLANININGNATGFSLDIQLPSYLKPGYYIVIIGKNYSDANLLTTFRVTVAGNTTTSSISSVMLEIGNTYNTFNVRLGSWSGMKITLADGANYISAYNDFSLAYYPVCIF